MKKFFIFAAILFSLSANIVFAQVAVMRPFGGKVFISPIPGAYCPEVDFSPDSPYAITPVGSVLPGPFSDVGNIMGVGNITNGVWILGLYFSLPIPDCVIGIPPVSAPLPVFKTLIFGTSS